jgi:hypothetical protein
VIDLEVLVVIFHVMCLDCLPIPMEEGMEEGTARATGLDFTKLPHLHLHPYRFVLSTSPMIGYLQIHFHASAPPTDLSLYVTMTTRRANVIQSF